MSRTWLGAFLLVIVVLLRSVVWSGCANLPSSEIAGDHVKTQLSGQTVQRILPDGTLHSSNPGVAGSLVNQDSAGQWTAQGLPLGLLSVNPATGVLTIASPKDVRILDLRLTPAPAAGEPFMTASSVEANLSAPLEIAAGALVAHIEHISTMNADEARRYVAALDGITEAMRGVLIAAIDRFIPPVPTP